MIFQQRNTISGHQIDVSRKTDINCVKLAETQRIQSVYDLTILREATKKK